MRLPCASAAHPLPTFFNTMFGLSPSFFGLKIIAPCAAHQWLLNYEMEHSGDVTGDSCSPSDI